MRRTERTERPESRDRPEGGRSGDREGDESGEAGLAASAVDRVGNGTGSCRRSGAVNSPTIVDPAAIEAASFAAIDAELSPHFGFSPAQHAVVRRVIHATADFDFARTLRFHPGVFDAARAAFGAGAPVVADVQMVQAGIDRAALRRFGGEVLCYIGDPDVAEEARAAGTTRAVVAMRRARRLGDGVVLAIGNAPTALLEVLRLVAGDGWRPALVVGVPVGFVSAVESKAALHAGGAAGVPYITALGRKGGTPVAVAAVNALLALQREPRGGAAR